MGLDRPKREELPALQEPEGSRLLTVRSVPLLLSQLLSPVWPLPAAMPKDWLSATPTRLLGAGTRCAGIARCHDWSILASSVVSPRLRFSAL